MPIAIQGQQPLIPAKQSYPASIGTAAQAVRNLKQPHSQPLAAGLENIQTSLDQVHKALRTNMTTANGVVITSRAGNVGAIGDYSYNGVQTSGGAFEEFYTGFPLGQLNPAEAVLTSIPGQELTIGRNGFANIEDPYNYIDGWIGTRNDVLSVTNAVNNGAGLVRLTVTGHTLLTGDSVQSLDIGGIPSAIGTFTVTKIDANTIDLQGSSFIGSYTSGGTVDRLLHVATAVDNGSGLIRVTTSIPHGYMTGLQVNAVLPGIFTGSKQYAVTVISSTAIDLQLSTFAGGYSGGGTVLGYLGGIYLNSFSFGGVTWPQGRIIGIQNGQVYITNAYVSVTGGDATTTLDPGTGDVLVTGLVGGVQTQIGSGGIGVTLAGSGATQVSPGGVQVQNAAFAVQASMLTSGFNTTQKYAISTVTVIDSSRNATFNQLTIGSTVIVDSSGNVNAASYKVGGTPGVSGSLIPTGTTITYSIPGGGSQSTFVLTGLNPSSISFIGGLRTS